jgi:hypothetical protein
MTQKQKINNEVSKSMPKFVVLTSLPHFEIVQFSGIRWQIITSYKGDAELDAFLNWY